MMVEGLPVMFPHCPPYFHVTVGIIVLEDLNGPRGAFALRRSAASKRVSRFSVDSGLYMERFLHL